LEGAYKTAVLPIQVLQKGILEQMTFTHKRSSSDSKLLKYLKFSKKFHLSQLNLPKWIVCTCIMAK